MKLQSELDREISRHELMSVFMTENIDKPACSSMFVTSGTYRLWSTPSPHTWSKFLLQTSVLTHIALGLVDRKKVIKLLPGPRT